MIKECERELAAWCLARTCEKGADWARVAYGRNESRGADILNGEIDKIQSTLDSAIGLSVAIDGRFGQYSTNELNKESLDSFIDKCLDVTMAIDRDSLRTLPDRDRVCRDAVTGVECGTYDAKGLEVSDEELIKMALDASVWGKGLEGKGYRTVSEEGGISVCEDTQLLMDSQGMECTLCETYFNYGVEITIEDEEGNLYSDYAWHTSPFLSDLKAGGCGKEAMKRAAAKINARACKGGKYKMVLDRLAASRMLSPVIKSLDGSVLQQNDSFLTGTLGKKVFSEALSIYDRPRLKGRGGSRYFDREGVATSDGTIIENGVIKTYFLNTYTARKMGMEATRSKSTHLVMKAWPEKGLDRDSILKMCADGIYVTGFNGGNYNSATGNFSYGVEGLIIRDGKLAEAVSGMLITGNMLDLWNNLIAVGEDTLDYMSNLIPTLAFENVEFNG